MGKRFALARILIVCLTATAVRRALVGLQREVRWSPREWREGVCPPQAREASRSATRVRRQMLPVVCVQ